MKLKKNLRNPYLNKNALYFIHRVEKDFKKIIEIMQEFYDYKDRWNSKQQEIMEFFHNLFLTLPNMKFKFRYGGPFYDANSWVCYIAPKKNGKVELVFINAHKLTKTIHLLEKRDRKQVAGIYIDDLSESTIEKVLLVIEEALEIDKSMNKNSKIFDFKNPKK